MRHFLDFLLREPWIAALVLFWVAGLIGNAIKKAGELQRQRERQRSREARGDRADEGSSSEAMRRPSPPPMPPRSRPSNEDEVAAEMRRILGLPAPPRPQAPRPVAAPPPPRAESRPLRPIADRPPPLRSAGTEPPPRPLQTTTLGTVGIRVDPHVGERMEQRRVPMSGSVGATDIGLLGGRTPGRVGRTVRRTAHLVDLQNLPRAIVLTEILGPPLALRDFRA